MSATGAAVVLCMYSSFFLHENRLEGIMRKKTLDPIETANYWMREKSVTIPTQHL